MFKLFYTNGICILQGLLVDTFFLLLVVICPPPNSLTDLAEGGCLCPTNAQSFCWEGFQVPNDGMGILMLLTFIIHFSQIWWRNFGQFRYLVWGIYCIHGVLVSNIYHFHTIFVVRLSYLTTVIFFWSGLKPPTSVWFRMKHQGVYKLDSQMLYLNSTVVYYCVGIWNSCM